MTKESFENAIMIHAAISGSTNATMHLPAIAHEFGIEIDADTFDRMHCDELLAKKTEGFARRGKARRCYFHSL